MCDENSILMTRGLSTKLGAVTLQASCSLRTFPGTVASKPEPRERWEEDGAGAVAVERSMRRAQHVQRLSLCLSSLSLSLSTSFSFSLCVSH